MAKQGSTSTKAEAKRSPKSKGSETSATSEAKEATGSVRNGRTGVSQVRDFDWNRVIRIPEYGQKHTLLDIPVKVSSIDEVAQRAIDETVAYARKRHEADPDRVVERINELGLTAEIAEVTRRLNRTSMSPARRFVLSHTYAWSLQAVLDDGGDPKDASGFVSRILYHQEQEGPHERFAENVVRDVARTQRLDLTEDGLLQLMVLRVQSTL